MTSQLQNNDKLKHCNKPHIQKSHSYQDHFNTRSCCQAVDSIHVVYSIIIYALCVKKTALKVKGRLPTETTIHHLHLNSLHTSVKTCPTSGVQIFICIILQLLLSLAHVGQRVLSCTVSFINAECQQ